MITQKRLKTLLDYNYQTGAFHWNVSKPGIRAGTLAGHLDKQYGIWKIRIDGKSYLSHRLAWLFMTGEFPEHMMGHANKQNSDNRWDNLLELSKVYSPLLYKKARVAMLDTRIGKLQMLKEQAVLDVQKFDPAWTAI